MNLKRIAYFLSIIFSLECVCVCNGLGETIMALPSNFYSWVEKPVNRVQNLFRREFLPTLWCGIRDVAPNDQAVSAIYPHLDACCRDHDHCPLIIDRGKCFQGLCNPSFLFPILACSCEQRFRKCLKSLPSAKSLPQFPLTWTERFLSDLLGRGYFKLFPKMFERKCVKNSHPIVGCAKWYDDQTKKSCLVHIFDKKSAETWQLFDIEDYNEGWFHLKAYVNDFVNSVKISDLSAEKSPVEEVELPIDGKQQLSEPKLSSNKKQTQVDF